MIEFTIFVVAFVMGYIIGSNKQKPSDNVQLLQSQIQQLNTEIGYYKDLCRWHVEEKEKLKQEHYIK